MARRVAVAGAGAVGGYVGGHLALHGVDVTLIDPWPEHVRAIRERGLELSGTTAAENHTVFARALHLCDVQSLSRQPPFDIVLMCTKSYDTAWTTMMMRPYIAANGCVVSVQNSINEQTIAEIVGWGRTLGCVASLICVEAYQPGCVRRAVPLGSDQHVVFRVGEIHGRLTRRLHDIVELLSLVDSTKATSNLWGERWSKLTANCMRNALAALTGIPGVEADTHDGPRRLALRLAGETVRVGQALGYELVDVYGLSPEQLAAAATGDVRAQAGLEEQLLERTQRRDVGRHRASMSQDVQKGRRTEIDALNGLVCAKGIEVGVPTPANQAITHAIERLVRGELKIGLDSVAAICASLGIS